jgi:hypothetical protein
MKKVKFVTPWDKYVKGSVKDSPDLEKLVMEQFMKWQKNQFDKHRGQTLPGDDESLEGFSEGLNTFYHRAANKILTLDVLAYLDPAAIGYIVTVNPFRNRYYTAALVGRWEEWRREIWLKEWMHYGEKDLNEGKLFKHIYGRNFGEVLLLEQNCKDSDHVSDITKKLDLGYAAVAPIIYGRHFIGIFTLGFSSADRADRSVYSLYRLIQLVLVPLLLPASQAVEEQNLIRAMTTIFRPIIDRIRKNLETQSNLLNEDVDRLLEGMMQNNGDIKTKMLRVRSQLREIAKDIDWEAIRGVAKIPCGW